MISVDSEQKVHHATATDGVQLGCFISPLCRARPFFSALTTSPLCALTETECVY